MRTFHSLSSTDKLIWGEKPNSKKGKKRDFKRSPLVQALISNLCSDLVWGERFGFVLGTYRWTDKRTYRHTAQIIFIKMLPNVSFISMVKKKGFLSLSIATILNFLQICTLRRHNYETILTKNRSVWKGHCLAA